MNTELQRSAHVALAASFSDPDAYAATVHNCQARILSTGRGPFHARLALARLADLSLFLSRETLPRRALVSLRPDRVFFGITAPGDGPRTQGGAIELPGTIRVGVGRQGVEDSTTGPVVLRSLSVPVGLLLARAEPLLDGAAAGLLHRGAVLRPPPTLLAKLVRTHEEVVRLAAGLPQAAATRAHVAAMHDGIWAVLMEAVAAAAPGRPAPRLARGRATTRRLFDFIDTHDDRPIRLDELCAAAGCSARTLETLFQDFAGEPPNRYLRRRRLWRAHTLLAAADPAGTTVAEIAVECGFWELGRFSVAYRRLFGESPSHTLRGAAGRQPARSAPPLAESA